MPILPYLKEVPRRLVATFAHPLNQAIFSEDGQSVIAGYTVLQPRVEIKPTSSNRSLFAQIYSGNTGIDLYTLAVSDVYQDLFGEGIYVGKGIYDVRAFEKSLAGQVQENTLLSHDLFEGLYGRAALVTDIILYEDFPARYLGPCPPIYAGGSGVIGNCCPGYFRKSPLKEVRPTIVYPL